MSNSTTDANETASEAKAPREVMHTVCVGRTEGTKESERFLHFRRVVESRRVLTPASRYP